MKGIRYGVLLAALALGSFSLSALSVPGYGWSSFGVLPFRGYDFVIVKAPTRYILYYKAHSTTGIGETDATDPRGRAFSTDLKNWTVDPSDICATSGDLRCGQKSGVLTLPDGRLRMFSGGGGGGLSSMISSDGVVWTQEPGVRLASDPSSIYERGAALSFVSFVNLPDGSVRMYYEGGIVPGSPGTPAYYTPNCGGCGAILSAISKDNGVTWAREPGVRINPLVQGPVNIGVSPNPTQTFYCDDLTAVSVKENDRTVFRIYCPTGPDGTVSYVSDDGLSFSLEGQIPADRGDAKAIVLPDGRIWLVTNQFPDAINDTIVYGPQSLFLNSVRADVGASFGVANPFKSVLMGLSGTTAAPVTFEAVGSQACGELCPFHPEYFVFSPSSGNAPLVTAVTYAGPSTYNTGSLVVHAKAGGVTAVGAVSCMNQVLGRSDTSIFCKKTMPELPMNKMNFGFSSGSPASSQTSDILFLGGQGYPFTASSSVPWATVSPISGTAPLSITVKVDPTGLAAGTYTGIVTITAEGATEKMTVTTIVSSGPVITSVKNAASLTATIAPNSFVTIFGSGFASAPVVWSPTTDLPATLGGVRVRINSKDAFISYADSGQLNVLTPSDTASGAVAVEVTTAAGTATSTAIMANVTPSWFAYTVGSNTWLAALFGNTATYVAPAGSLGGIVSRSAKVGDILQLYANGLGATNPPAPPGVVLTTAYPIDDLSRVKVSLGGTPAAVQFAGLVASGLYQVNVQVPSGIGTGDLPIVMLVDGQPTQSGVTLNFQ